MTCSVLAVLPAPATMLYYAAAPRGVFGVSPALADRRLSVVEALRYEAALF